MIARGYKLPFYADLSGLPESERRVIWGMMVGEEGKTKIPVYKNYTEAGFDPEKHVLQCYGTGWTSAQFLPDERQLFGLPGGFLNDWDLSTNLEGLFVAGDSLYASNCYGHAAATGHYAGRHAADYSLESKKMEPDKKQILAEKERVYSPVHNKPSTSIGWKELNMGISKIMKNYCGEVKHDELLQIGLEQLADYEKRIMYETYAHNPHELIRLLEVFDILTVSEIIIHSCLRRKVSSKPLSFMKYNSPEESGTGKLITIRQKDNIIITRELNVDFFGDLCENYERYNQKYIREKESTR